MNSKILDTKTLRDLVQIPEALMPDGNKRPDWDSFFMAMAYLVSTRSSCLDRKVGAVIVKDKTIIATGFNGAPRGVSDCLERGECLRNSRGIEGNDTKDYENCYATHGEANAIANSAFMGGTSTNGASIYTIVYPCSGCTKLIINAGIKKIYYAEGLNNYTSLASKIIKEAGIEEVRVDKEKVAKALYKSLAHLLIRDELGKQ